MVLYVIIRCRIKQGGTKMLKNLTPHKIAIVAQGMWIEILPEKTSARVVVTDVERGTEMIRADGMPGVFCPVVSQEFGEVEGLPEPDPFTIYIVSALVLSRVAKTMPNRAGVDVFAPDTGKTAIRDEKGNIVAVTRLTMGEKA